MQDGFSVTTAKTNTAHRQNADLYRYDKVGFNARALSTSTSETKNLGGALVPMDSDEEPTTQRHPFLPPPTFGDFV